MEVGQKNLPYRLKEQNSPEGSILVFSSIRETQALSLSAGTI